MKTILITGVCGFIGYHLAKKLLNNYNIVGIDNLNDYYNIELKLNRLLLLNGIDFIKCDICDFNSLNVIFNQTKPSIVINLAEQAGVRHSFVNPNIYIQSNILGFHNILECCKLHNVEQLIYASSSSVYGNNTKTPYSENDRTDNQISLYAITKKTNELEAYNYSTLYSLPTIGLRFFSVYGEFGRPDMSYYKFTKQIVNNKEIHLFGYGRYLRDFTYVGDIVNGIERLIGDKDSLYEIYNIGNGNPIEMNDFVKLLHRKAIDCGLVSNNNPLNIIYDDKQRGDVDITYADMTKFESRYGKIPHTGLDEGLQRFIEWFKTSSV